MYQIWLWWVGGACVGCVCLWMVLEIWRGLLWHIYYRCVSEVCLALCIESASMVGGCIARVCFCEFVSLGFVVEVSGI